MEFLAAPGVVVSIISLAVIAVTLLLRKQFGETEAERLIKLGQVSMHTAELIVQAADIAVVEVEEDLKKVGELSDEELKQEAVKVAVDLLANWGIHVDQGLIRTLFAVVESSYQNMKADQQFHILPVQES
jgi:hypothetical protein